MAIIYTYPVATPVLDDLLLISDSNDGKKTKNITITSLKSLINTQYTLTSAQNGADVDVKLNDNAGSVVSTVKLVKGSNVTLSNSGSNITISSTGGGGGGGSVDSVTTTDGTFIDLTPNGAATGAVTVTADLSATGTPSSTTFLRGDNTWDVPVDTIYSLPLASNGTRGGLQIGYVQNLKNYPLELSSEKGFVNVPWTDTTYSVFSYNSGTPASSTSGLVPAPTTSGDNAKFLRGDATWQTISSSGGSVTEVSSTVAGTALDVNVTNATTTPALAFTWAGASTQYVTGEGNLTTFPTVSNITSFTATQTGGTDADPNLTIADGTDFNLQVKGSGGTTVTRDSGGGFITIASTAPTATPPAGASSEVQYNGGGTPNVFAANNAFSYNGAGRVSVGNQGNTAGRVDIAGADSTNGELRLYCGASAGSSHSFNLIGPDHSGASTYSIKVPNGSPGATNKILNVGTYAATSPPLATLEWVDLPVNSTDITLTTSGTSGLATWNGTTLNIPVYSGGSTGMSSFAVAVNTGSNQTVDSTDNTLQIYGGTGLSSAIGIAPPNTKNVTIALDNTTVSAGTYGDASNVAQITVDAQGRITNATDVAISGGGGGGFPSAVTASSAAATSAAVDTLYTITTTSGVADIVVTLPTAASNSGKIIGVKYAAQNSVDDTVVIKTISTQTIDGINRTTNGLPLASVGTYYEVISDGSNWWIK